MAPAKTTHQSGMIWMGEEWERIAPSTRIFFECALRIEVPAAREMKVIPPATLQAAGGMA
jgi:hypothetical protein